MKKRFVISLYILITFSTLFSEVKPSEKQTIYCDLQENDTSDTCSLILTTVNETLQLLFSQLDSYELISNKTHDADITIKTTVKQEKNTFYITVECQYFNNSHKGFTIESNRFEVLQTFTEVDSVVIQIINAISGNNYSIQKLIINNGFIPDNIEVYIDNKHIKNEDLNNILSGSYHLKIVQSLSSGGETLLDLNPFIIGQESDTSLFLPVKSINERTVKLVTNHSYTSQGVHLVCPDWNDDWAINNKGQTIITFHARAMNDICINFAINKSQDSIKYQFNVGGWNNTKSVIRRYNQKYKIPIDDSAVISFNAYRIKKDNDYWVIFDKNNNTIAFGYGLDYTNNRVFHYKSKKSLSEINYFSFSSWDKPVEYSNIAIVND